MTFQSSLDSETPVAELFHENSKLPPRLGSAAIPSVAHGGASTLSHFAPKAYRTGRPVRLPPIRPLTMELSVALNRRRSVREFGKAPVALTAVGQLLGWSHGVMPRPDEGLPTGRTAPSAGALYPIEVYLAARRVTGLDEGTYHYDASDHCLRSLFGCELEEIHRSSLYPEITRQAAFVLILVAVFPRTCVKYGERGYRFVLLDCGHVAQSLSLVATALGLGGVGIGGFLDDQLNDLLELDGVDEAVVHTMAFGSLAR